uniref:Uncharacterized protein n=1 Tax=Anabas testudineus TaxID=64144 RepID=A0A3Q1H110_ANATE
MHIKWTLDDQNQDLSNVQIQGEIIQDRVHEKTEHTCLISNISLKHGGGNVIMWGCFSNGRVGNLYSINITHNITHVCTAFLIDLKFSFLSKTRKSKGTQNIVNCGV